MSKLVFYIVKVRKSQTPFLHVYLNTLRYLASPDTRNEAHVTVRGPKRGGLNDRQKQRYDQMLKGETLQISGPDCFFNNRQNTVYLRCSCRAFEKTSVWNKPDYGDGINPHVTLYDGDSRAFAEDLLGILKRDSSPCFEMTDLEIEKLESTPHRSPNFFHSLGSQLDSERFREVVNDSIDLASVRDRSARERLNVISYVWKQLCRFADSVGASCMREDHLRYQHAKWRSSPMSRVA